jgi:hypothetical protein
MTNLTNTQSTLIGLLSSALYSKPIHMPDNVDWDMLYDEALDQSVLPLVYSVAKDYIPSDSKQKWKQKSNLIIGKSMNVSFEHVQLHELMTSNSIPYVIIKGIVSASYYPQPYLRTFGDVDFVIRPEDMEKTEKIILNNGFTKNELETGIHLSFDKKIDKGFSSHWEMHQSVNGIPDNEAGEIIRIYIADLIATAVEFDEGNGMVRVADTFHHGLIMLLHTAKHLTSGGMGLRHLCDWVVFADHFTDDEFRSIFEEKLKNAGLWNFAQLLTLVGEKYLGSHQKTWAGTASDELLDSIICDMCNSGNFGKKNADREYQARYISNYDNQLIDDKNILRQILSMYDTKTRTICPIVNKLPILLPFAYIYIAVLYTCRVLVGKSRIDNKRVLKSAQKRKLIYSSFKLFEPQ